MKTIKLGDTVIDTVTEFQGVVVSRIAYLSGCVQYGVKAKIGKDGKPTEVEYIDEGQIKFVAAAKKQKEKSAPPPGGIMPDAPRK